MIHLTLNDEKGLANYAKVLDLNGIMDKKKARSMLESVLKHITYCEAGTFYATLLNKSLESNDTYPDYQTNGSKFTHMEFKGGHTAFVDPNG